MIKFCCYCQLFRLTGQPIFPHMLTHTDTNCSNMKKMPANYTHNPTTVWLQCMALLLTNKTANMEQINIRTHQKDIE